MLLSFNTVLSSNSGDSPLTKLLISSAVLSQFILNNSFVNFLAIGNSKLLSCTIKFNLLLKILLIVFSIKFSHDL